MIVFLFGFTVFASLWQHTQRVSLGADEQVPPLGSLLIRISSYRNRLILALGLLVVLLLTTPRGSQGAETTTPPPPASILHDKSEQVIHIGDAPRLTPPPSAPDDRSPLRKGVTTASLPGNMKDPGAVELGRPAPANPNYTEAPAPLAPSAPELPVLTAIPTSALLPKPRQVIVPKESAALIRQTGAGFQVAQRGALLIVADLPPKAFSSLVKGVVKCAQAALSHDYFGKAAATEVVTIYVFKNATTYRKGLRDLFAMAPISPYGHYGHAQRYIVVNYDTGPGTLVHELTHALMAQDFPAAPVWLSEGIASLYEQCRVAGKSLKGDPNWRLPELKAALQRKNIPPLKTIFAMTPIQFRAERESLNYAASRYFCRYLEVNGKLRPLYARLRDEGAQMKMSVRLIEEAFSKPFADIEADWHQWLKTESWIPKAYRPASAASAHVTTK